MLLLLVARQNGDRGLRVAEIDGLVRQIGWDEDEVAGFVDDALLKPFAVTRLDAALD